VETAVVWTREQLVVGTRARVLFSINEEDMQRFAALSGDHNPLHTSADFARRKGFEGPVVYGALLIAKVSQLIGMQLPGRDSVWTSFTMQFHTPLLVNEPAQVDGEIVAISKSSGFVTLKLTVTAADRVLAKGKAEVVVAEP
jgi:acyl dehydratase